jgi:hypothetical protein
MAFFLNKKLCKDPRFSWSKSSCRLSRNVHEREFVLKRNEKRYTGDFFEHLPIQGLWGARFGEISDPGNR